MKRILFYLIFLTLAWTVVEGQPTIHEVPGGKVYQITIRNKAYKFDHANYSVFIPDGIKEIRGVFIHQHGCTMEGHGAATAYDIQYQSFAKKWHLAVVGPDLYPQANSNCRDWINPQDGSGPALLAGLDSIACLSNHPELVNAPWLLWGHSGGGYWTLAMLNAYPGRVLGAVCYSPAFDPQFSYPQGVSKIPVMIRHAGSGDFNNPGVNCWGTALRSFSKLRKMGGLVSIAYNAGQNHNFAYLRYMAIPFFESILSQRLPSKGSNVIKEMDQAKAWFCDTTTTGIPGICEASTFGGDKQTMSWLPDSACAAKFREYISTGTVRDVTVPPAPENLKLGQEGDSLTLTWTADADLESGIRYFNIYKNDRFFARYPSEGDFQKFSTNGDDAVPVNPLPMIFRFSGDEINKTAKIGITTVNQFDLESTKTEIKFSQLLIK